MESTNTSDNSALSIDTDSSSDEEWEKMMGIQRRVKTKTGEVIHLPEELPGKKRNRKTFKTYYCIRCMVKTDIYCPQCETKPSVCLGCFRFFHNY